MWQWNLLISFSCWFLSRSLSLQKITPISLNNSWKVLIWKASEQISLMALRLTWIVRSLYKAFFIWRSSKLWYTTSFEQCSLSSDFKMEFYISKLICMESHVVRPISFLQFILTHSSNTNLIKNTVFFTKCCPNYP